jgi:hypothetical protein
MSEPVTYRINEWMMASLLEGRSVHIRGDEDHTLGEEVRVSCGRDERRAVVLGRLYVRSDMGEAWETRVRLLTKEERDAEG